MRPAPALAVLWLMMVLFILLPTVAAALPHGTIITNQAVFRSAGAAEISASVSVQVVVRTPSTVEMLKHVLDGSPAAVPATSFSTSGTAAGPFQLLPAPTTLGGVQPLALEQPLPLATAAFFKSGEPLFIRVTDLDQNLDPHLIETIVVRVTDPVGGDSELLLLSETGGDTGVFTGYLPTRTGSAPVAADGLFTVAADGQILVTYTDRADPSDVSALGSLVDPVGKIIDSATGHPVNGAAVTLLDADTGLPATVYGDDGVSPYPATVVSGGATSDGGGGSYDFPPGGFRFPLIGPGNYRLRVEPPPGYSFPSAVAFSDLQSLPTAPFALAEPASRGGVFIVNPGPVIRIDLPVDPATGALWLRKTAGKTAAAIGDFVPYRLHVESSDPLLAVSAVTISDRLPPGFRYRRGSARIDGAAAADPTISADGRTLLFSLGDLPAGQSREVRYVAEVAASARPGAAINRASAHSRDGRSNAAEATVMISEDLFRGKAFIMGRVTVGACDDDPLAVKGLSGVRILMEDGTFVLTDADGLYHFEGVRPGTHVVQLDRDSLPLPYEPAFCEENSRFAGRPFSQFVDLQGGTLWRSDFHVALKPRPSSEVRLEMSNSAEDQLAQWHIALHSGTLPLRNLRLQVRLPDAAVYLPGSAHIGADAMIEPLVDGPLLTFHLDAHHIATNLDITLQGRIEGDSDGKQATRAWLVFDAPTQKDQQTPAVETTLRHTIQERRQPVVEYLTLPTFSSLAADLDEEQDELRRIAAVLEPIDRLRITVVGHTDNTPIAARNRHLFADNFALAEARAAYVAQHLGALLQLAPEQITLATLGEAAPLDSNETPEGRTVNRRVEIRVEGERIDEHLVLQPVRAHSGMQVMATEGLLPGESEPADEKSAAKEATPQADGILSPIAGSHLAQPIAALRVQLDSRLKPRLLLNGKEIPADRIGFRMEDKASKKTLYSYIGVDFGLPGRHELLLQGLDPFGNSRFEQRSEIFRSGEIALVRLIASGENVADGKTPVRMRLELIDRDGQPIRAAAELELLAGNLQPQQAAARETARSEMNTRIRVDADGWAWFAPVTAAGPYQAVLGYDNKELPVQVYVRPLLRDWILVGLAEGTVGYRTLSGNAQALDEAGADEHLYQDGRLAFYAKGQVQGKWLLTMAYDSEKPGRGERGLFGTIDPDTYYPLYGDATRQDYDAASSEKLYLRIEREQFYALFGDYDAGLTVTELSRYSRSLTGLKSQWQGERFDLSVFASDTDQAFIKDELRGDGTSGLYQLSRRRIVLNSEKIAIEVRDRYRSEIVLSSRALTRHLDYSIDYQDGTLFFKAPVPSRDGGFNPVYIVVDYESADPAETTFTYGGRAAVRPAAGLEIGVTHVHEGQSDGNLYGVDAGWELAGGNRLRAELAGSAARDESGERRDGLAYLAELAHQSQRLDGRLYFREMEAGFGLGQQRGSEGGTRKYGLDGTWRLAPSFSLGGQAYRQHNLDTDAEREILESTLRFEEKSHSAQIGWRQATDTLGDGSVHRSMQGLIGGSWRPLERLTLRAGHEQALAGRNANGDFPTRTLLGADYQLARAVALFAEQEWTRGEKEDSEGTRIGLKATPWSGGQAHSSVEQRIRENQARVFANFGLLQTWQATPKWSLDGGLDRSQTVKHPGNTPYDVDVPPATGSDQDFTAVSLGATRKEEKWSWANRAEFRHAETENKWSLFSGIMGEARPGLGLSARAQIFVTDGTQGKKTNGEVRLGTAYRPLQSRWIVLDRLDFLFDRQQGGDFTLDSWRIVNNLNANYRPNRRSQLSLQYGAKYVRETIEGQNYSGFTDLLGIEGRYDCTPKWDVGLRGSMLHNWSSGALDYLIGPSVGYNVVKNAWVSVGYNVLGFHDPDFSRADFTAQGPYLKMRVKFDQDSVREALKWL